MLAARRYNHTHTPTPPHTHTSGLIRAIRVLFAFMLLGMPVVAGAQEAAPAPAPPAPEPVPGLATAVTRQAGLEGRVLWMDASANLQRLSTRDSVAAIFDKCRQANINTVVVDVKPLSGHVLYNSTVAPRLREWKGFRYPEGYDLLLTAMLEGRRRGIKVYASINVFSEGHKLLKTGPLYEKPELQAIVYDVERTVTAVDGASQTLAVGENHGPAGDQVVSYDATAGDPVKLGPDEAAVVVQGDMVTAVLDGALADQGPLPAPADGHVLVGRGAGARWLLEHIQVGNTLKYAARDVLQPILEAPSEAVGAFVNPANPESRAYMLRVVREIADNYAVDGLVFDRMRYSSLRTDFSPLSRELFEKWLGKPVENFPRDIYAYDPVPGRPVVRGPYYNQWLEWRAQNINSWLADASAAARAARPGLELGVYVGSWYSSYYGVGVNWGSDDYRAGYDWMTPEYASTGYAGKLDWLATGCYYKTATREDARQAGVPEEFTVEAAAQTSVRAVNEAAFVYAGLYVLDYQGKPDDFRKAVQAALQHSQGVMLFDLVYIEEYNWWNILSELFASPRRAPHDVPGLKDAIRETKKALQARPEAPP
jgi:uncharacterized lipoprotein YddW (UPF0748 family)